MSQAEQLPRLTVLPVAHPNSYTDTQERAKKLREDRARALDEEVEGSEPSLPARPKQSQSSSFDEKIVGRGQGVPLHNPFDEIPISTSSGVGERSPDRTLDQLASDSLDEFYQDEQVKENMSTANVGYRGFTTFGNSGGGVNLNSTGGSNNSVPSPSGSDTLTSEVRQRGDVKVPSEEAFQSQLIQQMQKGGGGVSPARTSPYLYDPSQHSLANTYSAKEEELAMPPRGRGLSRKSSNESRKVQQEKQRRAREERFNGMGVQGTGSSGSGAPRATATTTQVEEKFASVIVEDSGLEVDGTSPVPAPSPLRKSQSSSPSWKHKNTRDMNDLWTSPPRDKQRKKR